MHSESDESAYESSEPLRPHESLPDRIREWCCMPKHQVNVSIAAVCLITLCCGLWVGSFMEDWHPLTCIYVFVQILTTVGYGDFVTKDLTVKLVMSFFAFVCVVFYANVLGQYVTHVTHKGTEQHIRKVLRNIEVYFDAETNDTKQAEHKFGRHNRLCASIFSFLVILITGTVFFRFLEGCSCSYGLTSVEGCIDARDYAGLHNEATEQKCIDTGGYQKTYVDSFYMSMITMTTVGFGDQTPMSLGGRGFGIVFMLVGTASTAVLMGTLAEWFNFLKHGYPSHHSFQDRELLDPGIFDEIDIDQTGFINRNDFAMYLLNKDNLIPDDVMDHIDRRFNSLDKNAKGDLTRDDIAQVLAESDSSS